MITCAYCKSDNVQAVEKLSARRYLHIGMFFSQMRAKNTKEKITKTICVQCKECLHKYEKLGMKNLDWITKIFFTDSAISNMQSIFPELDVTSFLKSKQFVSRVIEVTGISKNNFHLIMELEGKRVFIDCFRYDKPVAAISVEEIYS